MSHPKRATDMSVKQLQSYFHIRSFGGRFSVPSSCCILVVNGVMKVVYLDVWFVIALLHHRRYLLSRFSLG